MAASRVPRLPGEPFTFINRKLDADPAEVPGGLGYMVLGVVNTQDRIAFTAGPIGGTITTPNVPGLFLANFLNPAVNVSTATVQLVSAGTVVFQATIPIRPLPEPTSALAWPSRHSSPWRSFAAELSDLPLSSTKPPNVRPSCAASA